MDANANRKLVKISNYTVTETFNLPKIVSLEAFDGGWTRLWTWIQPQDHILSIFNSKVHIHLFYTHTSISQKHCSACNNVGILTL